MTTMMVIMMMLRMMIFFSVRLVRAKLQSLWRCSLARLEAAQAQTDRPRQRRPGMEGNCLRALQIKCRLSSTAGAGGISVQLAA